MTTSPPEATSSPQETLRPAAGRTPLVAITVLVLLVGAATTLLAGHRTRRPDESPPAAACARGSVTAEVLLVPATAAATADQLDDAAGILTRRLAAYGCGEARVAGDRLAVSTSAAGEQHLDELIAPGVLQLREVLEAQPGTGCPAAPTAAPAAASSSACSTDHTELYRLGPAEVDGSDVQGATAERDQQLGEWQVIMHFTDAGQRRFTDLTSRLVGRRMAVVLDGVVITAPDIMERIDGDAQISGSFTEESAKALAGTLAHGALPVPLKRL